MNADIVDLAVAKECGFKVRIYLPAQSLSKAESYFKRQCEHKGVDYTEFEEILNNTFTSKDDDISKGLCTIDMLDVIKTNRPLIKEIMSNFRTHLSEIGYDGSLQHFVGRFIYFVKYAMTQTEKSTKYMKVYTRVVGDAHFIVSASNRTMIRSMYGTNNIGKDEWRMAPSWATRIGKRNPYTMMRVYPETHDATVVKFVDINKDRVDLTWLEA